MATIDPNALEQAIPRLRARFEAARVLVQQARDRAQHAAQEASAMRELLATRQTRRAHTVEKDRDIWDAAAAEILRATVNRDRALGVLAHELRQPLAAALAAHRLMALHPDGELAARAGGVLERQLLHLSKLVDGLLDFSRLALGAAPIDRAEVNVVDVVARALEATEAMTAPRGQRVVVTAPAVPLTVQGDATRLVQVFANLLQNASRYSPEGTEIVVEATSAADAVRITVADCGAGIPADLQPRIFEPFTRGSHDGAGLGIGLALARAIVELHGGQIAAASEGPGCGSTFSVMLPAVGADARRPRL